MARKSSTPSTRVDLATARRFWHQQQCLTEPCTGLAEALEQAGHVRTLGGVDVYLALRARVRGLHRRDTDEAVARREAQVIPAARGCIYLVPRSDVPVMLRLAEAMFRKRNDRDLVKAGLTLAEVDAVAAAVLEALAEHGPLTPAALRGALPDGLLRPLGDAGKKVGISSALPTALRHLEFAGQVERRLEGGRLDASGYAWAPIAPEHSPFHGTDTPAVDDLVGLLERAGRRFFRNAGPATRDDFATWSGAGKRDAQAAIDRLALVPVTVEGYAEAPCYVLEDALDALTAERDAPLAVALLPSQDTYLSLHEAVRHLVAPAHHDTPVRSWGAGPDSSLGKARLIEQRSILVGDQLAGFWEYDPAADEVVWMTLERQHTPVQEAISAHAAGIGEFIRNELGHGRTHSLDTDEKLAQRAQALRDARA